MSSIETERLLLRPFRESDAADVLEYLSGPLPHCFAGLRLDTLEEARAEVLKRSEDTEYCFAIVLKETGKVIGEIDAEPSDYKPPMLRSRKMSLPPPDTFTPSLILNAAHQGSGYAYEATHALFDIFLQGKACAGFIPMWTTTMSAASISAKNSACAVRDFSGRSSRSSTMPTATRSTRTPSSMPS